MINLLKHILKNITIIILYAKNVKIIVNVEKLQKDKN